MARGTLKCSWEMLAQNIEVFETCVIDVANLGEVRKWMKNLNLNYV